MYYRVVLCCVVLYCIALYCIVLYVLEYCGVNTPTYSLVNPSFPVKVQLLTFGSRWLKRLQPLPWVRAFAFATCFFGVGVVKTTIQLCYTYMYVRMYVMYVMHVLYVM